MAHKLDSEAFRAEYGYLSPIPFRLTHASRPVSHIIFFLSPRFFVFSRIALDLMEVFFQIVHTRLPLLNPAQFRARLKYSLQPSSSQLGDLNQRRSNSPQAPPFSPPQNGVLKEYKPLHNAYALRFLLPTPQSPLCIR